MGRTSARAQQQRTVTERELRPRGGPGAASENASTGAVNWLLTDNQGTVRDVAQYKGTRPAWWIT